MTEEIKLPTEIRVDVPPEPDYSEHPVNRPAIKPDVVVPAPEPTEPALNDLNQVLYGFDNL